MAGKIVKQLLSSLKTKEDGAEALCESFVPLIKSLKANQLSEVLEAIEKKEYKNIWGALLRHVESVVIELQASNEEDGFNAIGSTVSKVDADGATVYGRIVEAMEGGEESEENALFWSVIYDDGSTEAIPFEEADERIIKETNDQSGKPSASGEAASATMSPSAKAGGGLGLESVEALNAVATFALSWLNYRSSGGLKMLDTPEDMLNTAILLHDVLFDLTGLDGVACAEVIARVCETWWIDGRKGAELLVTQLMPYLLVLALSDEGKSSDAKRLYAIRGALLLFDFEDESIESLKGMLVRCAMHPRFVTKANKGEVGRSFLIFLFSLHPHLIESLHATIKNQLPLASPSMLAAYGDIYLRAWRQSDPVSAESNDLDNDKSPSKNVGVYRRNIENCIQEFMNVSIHAASNPMHKCCRQVLLPIHEGKNIGGCDAMLYKLWEPIIFRALNVANPLVRCNAVSMLADAFPLGTHQRQTSAPVPAKGKGNKAASSSLSSASSGSDELSENELLQKQFDSLMSLLDDCDPRVRAAASTTACHILTKFWEAIPANTSRSLLTTVTSKCAYDKTSSLVRVAAINSVATLLDQPLCHNVLKALLPSMKSSIHDNSEKVRHAMVSLLQRVSIVRSIKFFQVVSVEHLHARLALDYENDCLSSASAIVRLFTPSYLPNISDNERDEVHLKRCLTFLKQSPSAAMAFYSLASEHVAMSEMKNLVELLFSYAQTLSAHINEESSSNVLATKDCNVNEEEEEDDVDLSAPPTPDKRSKRKHRGKKGGGKKASDQDQATKETDESAEGRVLVALILECAARIFESLQARFSKSKNAVKEHESIAEKLMDEEDGIASLYRLLAQDGNSSQASRSALLKLAACLPKDYINDLGPLLLEVLGSSISSGNIGDLAPAVSLLCKCGSSSTVAELIKESFEAELAKNSSSSSANKGNMSLVSEEQDENEKDGKGKRKRKNKKATSSSTSSNEEPSAEGVLPLTLTLKIITALSGGADSLCAQARKEMVQDEQAVDTLVTTVKMITDAVTKACMKTEGYGFTSQSQVNMFINSIEVFGRLLTHITVDKCQDPTNKLSGACKLSNEMQEMLSWALNDLLPLTVSYNPDNQISMEGSLTLSPQKKKQDSEDLSSILSPPMKAKRSNGTSPVNGKATSSAIAAVSGTSSSSSDDISVTIIASEVVAAVLSLASDWAACGMDLKHLTSSAEQCAMFLINSNELNQVVEQVASASSGELKFDAHMGGMMAALGRLTYQLAVQESQGGSCPLTALSLLVRSSQVDSSSLPNSSASSSNASVKNKKSVDSSSEAIDYNEVVHGCVSQLVTLAGRRGSDTMNKLVHYVANVMIEHSMLPLDKGANVDLEEVDSQCLTSSGFSMLNILLKHRAGSKAFISDMLHRLSQSNETVVQDMENVHDMQPAQLLLHSACNVLRKSSTSDKFAAAVLSWAIEQPAFPGNSPASSPITDKRQLSEITSN